MSAITNINIEILKDHPDNPRVELGDLKELADSIKARGILQPLTVVDDCQDGYTVVIGHRRLAAAKLAGLTEVPCQVVEMTPQEQIQTMLMENMQREDLNPFEQAQGFQMMLDLGVQPKEIAEKTGFSQKTIKERAEWAKLDQKKLKEKSNATQLNFDDLTRLSDIKDIEKRNECLQAIGTSNYLSKIQDAVNTEKFEEFMAQWRKLLSTFAEKVEEMNWNTMRRFTYISKWYFNELKVPEDTDTVKYVYIDNGHEIDLYKLVEPKPEEDEDEEEEIDPIKDKFEELNNKAKAISKKMRELRLNFERTIDPSNIENIRSIIAEAMVYMLMNDDLDVFCDDIFEYLPILPAEDEKRDNTYDKDKAAALCRKSPDFVMLSVIFAVLDGDYMDYTEGAWLSSLHTFVEKYSKNEELDALYDLLKKLGYQMSDEELQMQDGTHPIFTEIQEWIEYAEGENN